VTVAPRPRSPRNYIGNPEQLWDEKKLYHPNFSPLCSASNLNNAMQSPSDGPIAKGAIIPLWSSPGTPQKALLRAIWVMGSSREIQMGWLASIPLAPTFLIAYYQQLTCNTLRESLVLTRVRAMVILISSRRRPQPTGTRV